MATRSIIGHWSARTKRSHLKRPLQAGEWRGPLRTSIWFREKYANLVSQPEYPPPLGSSAKLSRATISQKISWGSPRVPNPEESMKRHRSVPLGVVVSCIGIVIIATTAYAYIDPNAAGLISADRHSCSGSLRSRVLLSCNTFRKTVSSSPLIMDRSG